MQESPQASKNVSSTAAHEVWLATTESSKTVVIAAERGDLIDFSDVIEVYDDQVETPSRVKVIQRANRYYGPELLVHSSSAGEDRNYLITAPGPDSQLLLWAPEIDEKGMREGWYKLAEVTAELSAEQPPYEECDQCGELIKTIEHERNAVLGNCTREDTWK